MSAPSNHVCGSWVSPANEGAPLRGAVTGEQIARVSAHGIDRAAARSTAGASAGVLRALTFHQRAALLKALGGHLREHREEHYTPSARSGATLYDGPLRRRRRHRHAAVVRE